MGPAATCSVSNRDTHTAVGSRDSVRSTRALNSSWFATRVSLVANFGSLANAGSPSARLKRVYCSGFMMTTWTQPSLVRNASAGERYGLRLPTRVGR